MLEGGRHRVPSCGEIAGDRGRSWEIAGDRGRSWEIARLEDGLSLAQRRTAHPRLNDSWVARVCERFVVAEVRADQDLIVIMIGIMM